MSDFGNQTRGDESLFHIIPLEINIRINLVRDSIAAIISLETYVVRRRSNPQGLSLHIEWRFPNAQVIARGNDLEGFGVRPAKVLGPPKEIEWAHGHGQIGLFGNAFQDAVQHSTGNVRIHLDPSRVAEGLLHRRLRADDE